MDSGTFRYDEGMNRSLLFKNLYIRKLISVKTTVPSTKEEPQKLPKPQKLQKLNRIFGRERKYSTT